jgi:VanZ family protein
MVNWCRTNKRALLWALVLLWMLVIFCFSQQDGEQSEELSGGITEQVIELFVPEYQELPSSRQVSLKNQITFLVRKSAHFTEYLILGGLLFCLVDTYRVGRRRRFWYPWGIGTLYAASDEFHQMFSDGRSPQLRDVCIDSAGVLTGVLISLLVLYFYHRTIDKKGTKGLS